MKYYQEITIRNNIDVSNNFILSEVYKILHLYFVNDLKNKGKASFGLAFPGYQEDNSGEEDLCPEIGNKIRLFSMDEIELQNLKLKEKLQRLNDYIKVTSIRNVPDNVDKYVVFKRVHQENNVFQKVRRFIKRHDISEIEALKLLSGKKKNSEVKREEVNNLPYIEMTSQSNNNRFRLYIKKMDMVNSNFNGFGTYGLSVESTVPEF